MKKKLAELHRQQSSFQDKPEATIPQQSATVVTTAVSIKKRQNKIEEAILDKLPEHLRQSIISKVVIRLPDHCPIEIVAWRSCKHKGLYLRVYGFGHTPGLSSSYADSLPLAKRLKGMIIQVKWKKVGNVLMPASGFLGLAGTIDVAETQTLFPDSPPAALVNPDAYRHTPAEEYKSSSLQ